MKPLRLISASTFAAALFIVFGCSKNSSFVDNPVPTVPPVVTKDTTTSVDVSVNEKSQTIDGFGFFGAQDVWWGNASSMYSDAWATQVIDDLGITIWRNEYYPPATAEQGQDADWNKQKPVVEGLAKIAKQKNVPLKFVFTVWSPPAALKVAINNDRNPVVGTPNPGGTKNGGTVDPAKYTTYGNWLAEGIQLYKDIGIDVYAISPQNEPLFAQPFNSCVYTPQTYAAMLKAAIPIVKARFPNVKVFSAENMLEMEAGKDRQYFYNKHLLSDPQALGSFDIWAVHGYSDGVSPTSSSTLTRLWQTANTEQRAPTGKPYWMTETSGYSNNWRGNLTDKSGAINLALDMHSALYYGNVSAWIWWQGSSMDEMNLFNLMKGTEVKGKKYYVAKHFYRFIRPGAQRVKTTYNETLGVFASAYQHPQLNAYTIVLINNSDKNVKLNLTGAGLPDSFDYYITDATTNNCTKKEVTGKANIVLPASSVVTLVNGNIYE